MAAARCNRDIATGHGANAKCVDRAHCVKNTSVECDPVARVPIGERISADDPLAVEHRQIATAELFEQSPDGRLVQARSLRKRFGGRGSSVFGVELEQRNANAVRGGIVATPAIEHVAGPDHCLQGILDCWRFDHRPIRKRHAWPHGVARQCRGCGSSKPAQGRGCTTVVHGFTPSL